MTQIIYINNPCCYQFLTKNYTVTTEISKFIEASSISKIAIFISPWPINEHWFELVIQLQPLSDKILIISSELFEIQVNQLLQIDFPNVHLFLSGTLQQEFTYTSTHHWMDWWITTSNFYIHSHPKLLSQKLIHNNKPKFFDILLGHTRENKTFVYNKIQSLNLESKVIMSYFKEIPNSDSIDDVILEEEIEIISPHGLTPIRYYGVDMCFSQVVPISVYNQTYYSLVAESTFDNRCSFFTEKIVKPILAKRLFIVITGQHYLKHLQQLGFKTFNGIIDESYDFEPNNRRRWDMALEQVNYLCTIDPIIVQEQIQEIVSHNQNLMLTRNWQDETNQQMEEIISLECHPKFSQ